MQCEEVTSLRGRQLGLLATQPPLGLGSHGSRHLEGTGLSQKAVEDAIEATPKRRTTVVRRFGVGSFFGRVRVGGKTTTYRAQPRTDTGELDVGTY